SVASTASITMNGLERPVKKQRVSPLIPRYYQPLAKRVPGIAADRVKFDAPRTNTKDDRVIAVLVGCQEIAAGHSGFKDGSKANSPSFRTGESLALDLATP
ncbi:MAG: hypothetical protein ACLQNE_13290, partial [Thermoguttaceae bacterium]